MEEIRAKREVKKDLLPSGDDQNAIIKIIGIKFTITSNNLKSPKSLWYYRINLFFKKILNEYKKLIINLWMQIYKNSSEYLNSIIKAHDFKESLFRLRVASPTSFGPFIILVWYIIWLIFILRISLRVLCSYYCMIVDPRFIHIIFILQCWHRIISLIPVSIIIAYTVNEFFKTWRHQLRLLNWYFILKS